MRFIAACFLGLIPAVLIAGTRFEPASWVLWRAAPIPFPDQIEPQVPELMQGAAPIHFGANPADLTVIVPDNPGSGYDDRALARVTQIIRDKVRNSRIVEASQAAPSDLEGHVLLLGAAKDFTSLARLFPVPIDEFMAGIASGGYRIDFRQNPAAPTRSIIFAIGADRHGSWASGIVLAHSIHPNKPGVNVLHQWPVAVPEGCYWLPFSARSSPPAKPFEVTGPPRPIPPAPAVVFAVRIWGSPMPTLPSYQRLIRALKPTGINAVVVQSGGWVDLPNAPEIFAQAVEIAWQEGIYTILYAGNEEDAHLPAPLSENHRKVVLATKDHPGLLEYHLYNQLSSTLSPAERAELKSQLAWMKSVTAKPLGMEIVWGHRLVAIPENKAQLMRDLKSWGLDRIATDYAPIGGWTDKPYLPRWEEKLVALRPFEAKPHAVLQAHVPFLEATVPTGAQLRNQFWWAVAGGAQGFMVEAAYLHTHYSMRGLLSWDFRPLPDGRYDELSALTKQAAKLQEFIVNGTPATAAEMAESGISLSSDAAKSPVHLRLRRAADQSWYVLLVNEDLTADISVRLHGGSVAYRVVDLLASSDPVQLLPNADMAVTVPRGGGRCFKLTLLHSR